MKLPSGKSRSMWRLLAIETISASVLVVAGAGVYGALNATAVSSPLDSGVGTISLTLGNGAGSSGFSTAITNMVPGDAMHRYVTLNNGGSLDGVGLNLQVDSAAGDNAVLVGTTAKAFTVQVTRCSQAWSAGSCGGTSTTLLAATPVGDLAAATALSNITTFTANTVAYLQVRLMLPNQDETTVNGVFPTDSIQGGAGHLTFTFRETQRTADATQQG